MNTKNATVSVAQTVKLQKMDLSALKEEAKRLGVTADSNDKADLIASIISAGVSDEGNLEPYQLIPLHTQTEAAQQLIYNARNHIMKNEAAGHRMKLFQKNAEGNLYTRVVSAASLTPGAFKMIVDTCARPFEGQDVVINDALDRPEEYEKPAVVRISKRQADGKNKTFVMLALRKRCNPVATDFDV